MNINEAIASVGTLVMSRDAGGKMVPSVSVPHGPYQLISITKSGFAILKGREEYRVPLSLISRTK